MVSRRSPHGERGLKPYHLPDINVCEVSLPTRGAWIETAGGWSPPLDFMSLPTRGAWIETPSTTIIEPFKKVAPHTGSVD